MEHHSVCMSLSHELVVDLVACESLLTLLGFALLTHGSPYVSDENVCVLCSDNRRICHLELVAVLSSKLQYLNRGLIVIGAGDGNAHAHLQAAYDKRISHIVSVTDEAHLQSVKASLELADSHKVSQYLTGVTEIGKSVDYRDRAVLSKVLDLLLLEGTDHDTVKVARENSCCVLNGLSASDLEIV